MDHDSVIKTTKEKMKAAVDHVAHEFSSLHTGKASPAMVETLQVHVEAYGTSMALKEMAAVTTPDARTIQIQPWDKNTLKPIEKAIQTANLGFNPVVDGTIVRIPIPELSGDRRKELVKVTHNMAEEGRVSIRHTRRDALDAFKKLQKDSEISEDDYHRFEKEVQDMTDSHIKDIDEKLVAKEKDLTSV